MVSKTLELIHQDQILGKILFGEPGKVAADIALGEVVGASVLSSQNAAGEWGVRDDSYAKFSTGLEESNLWTFDIDREGAVLALDGTDGVDGGGTRRRLRRGPGT